MSGQTLRNSSLTRNDKHVQTTHAIRCKSNLFTVRAPHRRCVVCRMRSQLHGTPATDRHRVNIAFISEGNGRPIRRNGTIPHPQRRFLCQRPSGQDTSCGTQQNFLHVEKRFNGLMNVCKRPSSPDMLITYPVKQNSYRYPLSFVLYDKYTLPQK